MTGALAPRRRTRAVSGSVKAMATGATGCA